MPGPRTGYQRMPPLGAPPEEIATYVNRHIWEGYHAIRRPWLREVEENIRALSGHQYDTYVEPFGEFINLAQYVSPHDEAWRRDPVFNWLGQHWFQLSLAKLTENIPILGALPATADQADAVTAALFDPVYRYEWTQMGMPEQMFRAYGWLLVAGVFVLKLRWDPERGALDEFRGPATFDLDGTQTRQLTQAPYVQQPDGSFGPGFVLDADGRPVLDPVTGEPQMQAPHRQRAGDLDCEVPSPTAILFPYGPEPYWKKRWVIHEYLMSCEEIEDVYGVHVEPEPLTGQDDLLLKMEYTSAYGMPGSGQGSGLWAMPQATSLSVEGLVRVRERWERDGRRNPQGRLTLVTHTAVLYDDVNPFVTPDRDRVLIPIFRFERPGFPFRQEGTSDLEALKPVARARNRAMGNLLDASDMTASPPLMYNSNAITDDQGDAFNTPGGQVKVDGMGLGDVRGPAGFLQVPPLPPAVAEISDRLQAELQTLGHASVGGQGNAVTNDASGELQREVRFDADRPWGATLRLHSYEWARFGQTVMDILAVCLSDTRVLALAGEDQAAQFLTVRPDLFRGRINVYPQPESAVLETRQDKQRRITEAFTVGAQLAGANPQLAETYFKVLQFPDIQRALRPGGDAYSLAVRQVAEMLLTGVPAPVLPEQDHATHLLVVNQAMQTATYRDAGPAIQTALRMYRTLHEMAGAMEGLRQAGIQAAVMGEAAQMEAEAGGPAAETMAAQPQPEAGDGGGVAPARGPRRVA